MTAILGISALYHDSAAALVVDGKIIAAAQEERFSRVKNDRRFPSSAIQYCLQAANLEPAELDFVAFYEKPLLKFDRVLENWCAAAPRGFRAFAGTVPSWLKDKLHVAREVRGNLPGFTRRVLFVEHHESHAASAFFPSPFDEAAILTVDGVGEWATATIGIGRGNHVQLLHELRFPHSLGLLYSAFTYYCGFAVDAGEYKLMGLAPYGAPTYTELIRRHIVEVKPDGSLWLDMSYFDYGHGLRMTSDRLHQLLGGPPRTSDAPLEQRHLDIAASIQQVTEDVLLQMARFAQAETGVRKLCLAGGVALNAVANGRLLREGPFDELWIQPAAGDAGGALGAALLVWHQLLGCVRPSATGDAQCGSLLGPDYAADSIRAALEQRGATYQELGDDATLCSEVAGLLAARKVVGWFQGRMEFGPRALGSRSILADPRDPAMQALLNQKIKFRESFRPFAPAVLAEHAHEYFELPEGQSSPYMLIVARVCPSKRVPPGAEEEPPGLARQAVVRSQIPAVTHVDNLARVQTVDALRSEKFARLLHEFHTRTGCPLLVNTSFNVRDEPIVCSPADAVDCFMATDMDALAIGNFLLLKDRQAAGRRPAPVAQRSGQTSSVPALMAGESLIGLHQAATTRQLRWFGAGLSVMSGLLVLIAVRSTTWPVLWWGLTALLAATTAIYWIRQPARPSIYRACLLAAFPLNWIVSTVMLVLIYFGILTPIAFCLRLAGRDMLQRRPLRDAPTCWRRRRPTVDRDRYLRQF